MLHFDWIMIEVCLDSLESVAAAAQAGAERIELCSALTEGGLTPSLGILIEARRIFPGTIVHMIRPRRGDFHYNTLELEAMATDIQRAIDHGADELVFGCLYLDGSIDRSANETLINACGEHPYIFHRAFDVSRDLGESLHTLIEMKFRRVLTSGGEPNALLGAATIRELIAEAKGRIEILPGGGIRAQNAADILEISGATQLHLTAHISHDSPMIHRRTEIPMGASKVPGEYEFKASDASIIRQIAAMIPH